MTADLIFYIESFGGNCKIPADEFPVWERRASAELGRITSGTSNSCKDEKCVKMCICEIAECLYEQSKKCGIVSESNDGYSAKYETGDTKKEVGRIAALWLSGTDMLYRGV